jgi:Porin subfamily
MKMVRSVLLGSAAGLVAVTAGQAADLPVKAQPVQYVKVCSMYGAGFYYMPGTEMCLKVGGWVRAELTDQANGSLQWGPFNGSQNNRATNNLTVRARGYITADAREQTAYGVARGYIAVGLTSNDVGTTGTEASNTFSANRAFVQWAGFTAGLGRSFYDFYNASAINYRAGYMAQQDTGDGGWWTWAYTANFGGGFSGTIAAEARRMNQIIGQGTETATTVVDGSLTSGVTSGLGYGGWQVPDIVGNLRVDQAWGNAQVMAALHEVNAPYYGTSSLSESNGHPSDQWGFAVGAGLHINLPMFGPADYVEAEGNYSQGASKYDSNSQNGNFIFTQGGQGGYGINSDCVYGGAAGTTGTSCMLTTAWSVAAAYEHFWTPQWHQSFSGSYIAESYSSGANAVLCELEGAGIGGVGTAAGALAGCNNNWSYWTAGSRLQWDVTKSFYIGVEALYMKLNSASAPGGVFPGAVAAGFDGVSPCGTTGNCAVANQSDWAFTLRMHKDFLP